ncbi:MAG: replicative DNA helicase [Bacteroidales bacterium]|nr:replicative DNA helicase [Bacteroidales bacterium]
MARSNSRKTDEPYPHITDAVKVIGLEQGKLPPQALDMEEAVLGAVMLEKDAIYEVVEFLKPECFYIAANGRIFQAITDLSLRGDPIDTNTVVQELRRQGHLEEVGGPLYITQLTLRVLSAAHVEYHARIIYQKYLQRELIRIATEIQNRAFDDAVDVYDVLNNAEQSLFDIAQSTVKQETQSIATLMGDVLTEIQNAGKREDSLSGVPSGYVKLDRLNGGWQKSDLIIIAARPSMGKTAFALSMARNMALDHNTGVAIFSLEMSATQLVKRLIISETELAADKIRSGRISPDEWAYIDQKIKALVSAPIFIDDTASISVSEFRTKCRRLVKKERIGIIMVDYLQLMTWGGNTKGNREQEVSNISRSLKAIAKDLNIPIIALSQLNRGVETRTGKDKRPQLADLRESGAIEQDADMVLMIHRPEYYGMYEDGEGNSMRGIAEIIVAKHRNGALDTIQLRFQKDYAKFTELADGEYGDSLAAAPEAQAYTQLSSRINAPAGMDMPNNTSFDMPGSMSDPNLVQSPF